MIGNKTDDFHKQIILLNFNKFQFNQKQYVKQVLNKCLGTVKLRQWRSKLKQKNASRH